MCSSPDIKSDTQPQIPESSATRELSKEPKNITSDNHILRRINTNFTSNGVEKNVV